MYAVRRGGLGRLAGAHTQRLGRLGFRRAGRLGDISTIDASVINDLITTGGQVAAIAEAPTPTTSIVYPSGIMATTSGGATLSPSLSSSLAGTSSSSILLLGGLALGALLLVMSKR